jgi:tRNA dimethylallyltransferase
VPEQAPLIAVVGPTASGKTSVGIALAERLGGEIISADAVAVYRRLDIGAAKPDNAERTQARFHLIDVADPWDDFTVADFAEQAEDAISDIRRRGRTPLLVGGTGLYVRSVTATLSVPEVPPQPELRAALWAEVAEEGASALHARLAMLDAVSAAKILPGDAKRIIRALEVQSVTGLPASSFHTPEGIQGIPRANSAIFGLRWERLALYRRIEERVDIMMESGFLQEVRELRNSGVDRSVKSVQSLGYRHLYRHLDGEIDLPTAVDEIKRDTRRFAKRQMSWFNADPRVCWIDGESEPMAEAAADKIAEVVRSDAANLSFAEPRKEAE